MRVELNLKQLTTFYHVAKTLSFTRAGEELCISQPAVTMQISALEEQYGVPLFSRRKNEISLTDAGAGLLEYAEPLVRLASEAHLFLVGLKSTPHGLLRIGTTNAFAKHLLAPHVLKYRAASPKVRIRIKEGNSKDIALSLLLGANDLAIICRIPYDDRLEAAPFSHHPTEELVLIVPPGHRLSERDRVTLDDIVDEPLILRDQESGIRHRIESVFAGRGLTPTVAIEAANTDLIQDLVANGAGASILPKISLERRAGACPFRVVSFAPDAGMFIYVDLVVPRDGYRPLALTSFLASVAQPGPNAPAGARAVGQGESPTPGAPSSAAGGTRSR